MSRNPVFHTTSRGFPANSGVAVDEPFDALARPSNDDLITAALSLWPQGAAWGSPDGEAVPLSSVLARFTRVLIDGFAWLYGRAFRLALEASPQGAAELLPEWERDHGLPEPCFTGDRSIAERLSALAEMVRGRTAIHPQDFIRIAAIFGFEIEIEEPAVFGCGFSECGGYHETASGDQETYWVVRVRDAALGFFEAATSECGYDPLFSTGEAEQILCLLRKLAPAWTLPILMPWRTHGVLTTETGQLLTDEFGNVLIVPL
ncbi:hypothetical protein [Mycoplana ramosa]|uniref:DUF2313 domain-containing protein n=1 Tax=Mycoplana ramosa TaxID=40837 RepID=A0ABW3YWL4_MYCRA